MPNKEYVHTMARYNLWQNKNLINAADRLSAADRDKDRGSFFGSIQKTASHILWADRLWMSRFAGTPKPEGGISDSVHRSKSWEAFCIERKAFDARIFQWAHEVKSDWFEGDLSWFSGATGLEFRKPKKMLVMHFFNHQTHHRGQIHAMLTASGETPEDTDIPFMPERFLNI